MGAYVCGVSSGLDVAENAVKFLVFGFKGAGKTYIVSSWSSAVNNSTKAYPTDAAMFNVEKIKTPVLGLPVYMWDISSKMIERRRSYYLGSQGLVYVVDAVDGNVTDIMADLESLLTDRDLSGLPLLILVNKVGNDASFSAAELKPQLQQHVHVPPRWAVCDIHMFSQHDLSEALIQLEELIREDSEDSLTEQHS